MAPLQNKRRRGEEDVRRPKKKIRIKKQAPYHSSSEGDGSEADEVKSSDIKTAESRPRPKSILKSSVQVPSQEEAVVEAAEEDEDEEDENGFNQLELNTALNAAQAEDSEASEADAPRVDDSNSNSGSDDDSDLESETTSLTSSQSSSAGAKKKRNDPTAFATSISKILDTKLTTSKRSDPVLSRSKTASEANKSLNDQKLEAKARSQIRSERRAALDRGRVTDVLGLDTPSINTSLILEEEKRLKKTAQRGVVKLFNAVRAAQVRAEEGMRQARSEGVVGMGKREERVNEMSKEGFLEMISRGGKGGIEA